MRRPLLIATMLLTGCGGAQQVKTPVVCAKPMHVAPQSDDPTPPSGPQPIEVSVTSARDNGLIRVDVSAVGRSHTAQEGFEEPSAWHVTATAAGQDLRRLVLGPVRVERCPVGDVRKDNWDVTVAFSMYYQMPAQAPRELAVALTAPDETAEHKFTLPVPPAVAQAAPVKHGHAHH